MTFERLAFSNINLNLGWIYNKEISDKENFIFSALTSCNHMPIVLLENTDGSFKLQFRKQNSVIKLNNNQLWYSKNHLTSIMKLPSAQETCQFKQDVHSEIHTLQSFS